MIKNFFSFFLRRFVFFVSSIPKNKPKPLTSEMIEYFDFISSKRFRPFSPSVTELLINFSSKRHSIVASAAAHPTELFHVIVTKSSISNNIKVFPDYESGHWKMPPPRPFPTTSMSGTTSKCSQTNILPVRPIADGISSNINKISLSSQILLTRFQ